MDFVDTINAQKNKVVNIVIIILALLIANNIYKGQAKNIAMLRDKKEAELEKNAVLNEIVKLEKKIAATKNMVNSKDISTTINTLSNLAKDSSVKIVSLRPQTEKDYPFYVKYSFDLNVKSSSYHQIGKFISRLENSTDIYAVELINIRPIEGQYIPETEATTDKINAELKVSTILIK